MEEYEKIVRIMFNLFKSNSVAIGNDNDGNCNAIGSKLSKLLKISLSG